MRISSSHPNVTDKNKRRGVVTENVKEKRTLSDYVGVKLLSFLTMRVPPAAAAMVDMHGFTPFDSILQGRLFFEEGIPYRISQLFLPKGTAFYNLERDKLHLERIQHHLGP